MGTLFTQADIVTGKEGEVFHDAWLLVEDGRIADIGTGSPHQSVLSAGHARISASGRVLMPAFYNAHTHIPMTLLRNYADDMDLQTWLFTRIFPAEDKLDADAIDAGTRLGMLEMLAGGTAGFTDMYYFCDRTAQAAVDAGMRLLMTRGLTNTDTEGDFRDDARLLEAVRLHKDWHGAGAGRIRVGFGPHAVYTCSPAYLRAVAETADRLDATVHVHVDETLHEHDTCLTTHGMTPAALCEAAGLFHRPAIAAHCVHVTDEDLDMLARNRVTIAHNPRSNLKLASGIAPVRKARAAGVPIAIGTDGASSNNTLDMWAEMGLAALVHKGALHDPLAVPAHEALHMAGAAGAAAMGFPDAGLLAPGYRADLVMADCTGPHWQPRHNLLSAVVYSGRAADVRLTMVEGKVLYRNGEYTTLDAEKIRYEVGAVMDRLFGSAGTTTTV